MLRSFNEFKYWLNNIGPEKVPNEVEQNFEQTVKLLKYIWDPYLKSKHRIIVWWTAWKWTVVRAVHEILLKHDLKVASFLSPHVSCFTERIRLWNKLILEDELLKATNELICIVKFFDYKFTYYSAAFFIFIIAAKNYWADVLSLEVWLWWEFDCTNAICWDRISVITFIWKDHLEILWPNLEDLAEKKIKIFNKNTIAWFSYEKKFASLIQSKTNIKVDFINESWYKANLILARKISEFILNKKLKNIKKVNMPARWEKIDLNWKNIIFDWAHSEPRILEICNKLAKIKWNLYLLISSKDTRTGQCLRKLGKISDNIYITEYDYDWLKSVSSEKLKKVFKSWIVIKDPLKAFNFILDKIPVWDSLVVTGSFHLCWILRTIFYPEKDILKTWNEFASSLDC